MQLKISEIIKVGNRFTNNFIFLGDDERKMIFAHLFLEISFIPFNELELTLGHQYASISP